MARSLTGLFPTSGWEKECYDALKRDFGEDLSRATGLVNGAGKAVTSFNNDTWGIDINTCYRYCDTRSIPLPDFNFQSFSSAFTNYLLPYVALTAQLPYETGGPWSDVMSFCVAVGSPTLITYSLTVTILNRYWIRARFNQLLDRARSRSVADRYPRFADQIQAVLYFLSEAQQVPLRASQDQGWLSSLLLLPQNYQWWQGLQNRLRRTRRGVTASLVAQTGSATIAWLFTIISSFRGDIDDLGTVMQKSAGNIWIWLIPISVGFVIAGTQNTHDAVDHCLSADEATRVVETVTPDNALGYEMREQLGLKAGAGIMGSHSMSSPTWVGLDVDGDESQKGPAYNYARIITWSKLASTVESALEHAISKIENGERTRPSQEPNELPPWNCGDPLTTQLQGDSGEVSRYVGLDEKGPILPYTEWNEIDPEIWWRMIISSLVALTVQWGTTGASIMMAYLTPVPGLSCRSGGYLIYGVLATIGWMSLLSSMLLSHSAMVRYQRACFSGPAIGFAGGNQYQRSTDQSIICGLAVVTRYLGKAMAILNSTWLIISTIFEYIGFYNNCWCNGVEFGLGNEGWVALFKSADDFRQAAGNAWGGGIAMSVVVCVFSTLIFVLGARKLRRN